MAQLINLTPHPITILGEDNSVVKVIPSTGLVRLKASTVDSGNTVDGVKITKTVFGEPEGLPEEIDGYAAILTGVSIEYKYYIVSQLVKSALPQRKDLLVPAEVVRDTNGNIIGCKSLGI